MGKYYYILLLVLCMKQTIVLSQDVKEIPLIVKDSIKKTDDINPLAPTKAAFYSALVPGLGQAYNKKYWKIPLVYTAIGISVYSYITSNTKYHTFRDAYKRRLEGYSDDSLSYLDSSRLLAGQKFYQRNRDLSSFFIIGFYVLNIVDANVDAHLMQFNVNDNLSIKPDIQQNDLNKQNQFALTLNYHF
ncbi:hypothetical protein B0A77_06050 [Flavobacterium branchiophilum]|uniref:DUF5683 domain-containing protein n=2 Tax=Flavobacterium branchiophilum TaxID=55197 RepID=A0A2H3KN38_9FLAO|nr:hypothetical protein B0A77_06050 [Flavobacterium branchiophilum]